MIDANDVRRAAPSQLDETASMAHRAVQHLTRAARANLAPAPDDSHSNLSWMEDGRAFLSQPMTAGQSEICIGISILEFELFVMRNGARESLCQLDGARDADVAARLDALLAAEGLKPSAPITLPYDLPAPVAQIDVYALSSLKDEIKVLASWYSLAAGALSAFEAQSRDITPGPSPVRCWPHHFDIATYLSLEEGDFETSRGIGIGMSPGDESYGEPYFYVNPWPHLDPETLPPAPAPGHWHTDGFVGAIATATEILALSDIKAGVADFIASAASAGRQGLGA